MSNSFVTPWSVAHQVPLSMGFSRQEYYSGLSFPSLGNYCYCCCVVQLLSHVWLFETPWTAAHQASLSFTISRSLLKFMSIELVMLSNHLILCRPPSPLSFNLSQHQGLPMSQLFTSGGQSIGASACTSVLPMNFQRWFPLGLIGDSWTQISILLFVVWLSHLFYETLFLFSCLDLN